MYFIVPIGFVSSGIKFLQKLSALAMRFSVMSTNIRGLDICYLIRNPRITSTLYPPPIVILLHGITVDKYSWLSLIRRLPKSWGIVAVDLPGHGDSGFKEEFNYSPIGVADILHEFFEKLGLSKFHLIGQSLGSAYTIHYTSVHPEMILSLTLLSLPGVHRVGGTQTDCMKILDDVDKVQDTSVYNPLLPRNGKEAAELRKIIFAHPRHIPFRLLEALTIPKIKKYPVFEKIISDVARLSNEQVQKVLETFPVPTQVIWGQHDNVCHVSGAETIRSLGRNIRVTVIKDCGHAITIEQPKVCTELIISHITNNLETLRDKHCTT